MIRKLLIVFASGLVLSILLLSAAWVVGGGEMVNRLRHESGDWGWHGHDSRGYHGPQATRSLIFDARKVLRIDVPASVHFTRGDTVRMTVEGPGRLIERLRWQDGRLSLGGHAPWFVGPIDITITAPQIPGLELHGASDVELIGLDQRSFTVDAFGAVDLEANGKVRTLSVNSHGAGDLDLERVEASDATVRVAGVGDVDISATGKVDAAISGAGDITLHRKPADLASRVSGFGEIRHDY